MKKFAAVAVAASMFALAACDKTPTPPTPTPGDTTEEPKAQPCDGPMTGPNADCKIP